MGWGEGAALATHAAVGVLPVKIPPSPRSTGLLESTPEFMAEPHLGPVLSTLVALLYFTLHAVILLPGLAAVLAIMGESSPPGQSGVC